MFVVSSWPATAQFDFPWQPCLDTPDVTLIQTYRESSSKDSKEHDIMYIVQFKKKQLLWITKYFMVFVNKCLYKVTPTKCKKWLPCSRLNAVISYMCEPSNEVVHLSVKLSKQYCDGRVFSLMNSHPGTILNHRHYKTTIHNTGPQMFTALH